MNERRFRAYDKKRGRYVSSNIHIDATGLIFWQFADSCRLMDIEERDNIIIEWSTGFHDSKDVEIWRGSIIPISGINLVVAQEKGGAFILVDGEGKLVHFLTSSLVDQTDATVIGDTMQTPDLMEVKK